MENEQNNNAAEGKAAFKERLSNFWYYHKWHTLVALAAVLLFTVLILQTCERKEYDAHILYAGSHQFSRISTDGDIPEYNSMLLTLKKFADDYNGDGEISLDMRDLYVMTSEEINAALEADPDADLNESRIMEDGETLLSTLLYSEYFLVFISDDLFRSYEAKYEGALFEEIGKYTDTGSGIEYEYASEHGIYLRSLPFKDEAVVCNLPDDTVVCVRKLSEVSATFDKDTNTENHSRAENMIRKILKDK